MEIIEPAAVFASRCASNPPALPRPLQQPPRPLGGDFWTAMVFDVLRQNGDEPARITGLVNSVARLGNYSRRDDYDRKRIELFKLVGRMLRDCRLDRVGRKHVTIPRTDARRRAYLEAAAQPLDLPPPSV